MSKPDTTKRPCRLTRSERLDYMKSIAGGLPVFLIIRGPRTPQEADHPRMIWGKTLGELGRMADYKLQKSPQPRIQPDSASGKPTAATVHWAAFCGIAAIIAAGAAALDYMLYMITK